MIIEVNFKCNCCKREHSKFVDVIEIKYNEFVDYVVLKQIEEDKGTVYLIEECRMCKILNLQKGFVPFSVK